MVFSVLKDNIYLFLVPTPFIFWPDTYKVSGKSEIYVVYKSATKIEYMFYALGVKVV